MDIIINGRHAVLKKDFSFEYVSENRLFMGRDGYTLNIVFPLKDCPENIAIFGHINRMDVAKDIISLECAIIHGEVSLFGSLSVLKISEVEAECQFAEGKCSQTLEDPFSDVYISDLNLGTPSGSDPANISPSQAWKSIDQEAVEVALPWVNENSPNAPNNWVNYESGTYSWNSDNGTLSWQPYLIVIAKRICDAIGYEYDFAEWEGSTMRHLIVCNSIPGGWGMPQYANVMPLWTVSEFFEKLEFFLMCEFDFDHKAKSVRMRFSKNVIDSIDPVAIDDIVDSYSVEVSQSDNIQCSYIAAKHLCYKECSHPMWNYYSCDWYVGSSRTVKRYPTLAALIAANKRRDSTSGNTYRVDWGESMGEGFPSRLTTISSLLYAEDIDTYFVFRSIGTEKVGTAAGKDVYTQIYVLQPVNVFGNGSVEDDSVQSEEIEFLPACVMDTFISQDDDKGYMMFLTPRSSGTTDTVTVEGTRPGGGTLQDPSDVSQPGPAASIANGESEKSASFYDDIFVAFWTGTIPEPGKTPYPIIDGMSMVSQDWQDLHRPDLSMRISSGSSLLALLPQIDPSQKFKISWLGDKIPNPRAIFHIRGRRYVCEKITAAFSTDGMSQLLKGEFYPLNDEENDD